MARDAAQLRRADGGDVPGRHRGIEDNRPRKLAAAWPGQQAREPKAKLVEELL